MQISRYKGVKAETGKYPTWKNGEQTSSDERICQNPYNCKTKLSEMLRLKNVYFFQHIYLLKFSVKFNKIIWNCLLRFWWNRDRIYAIEEDRMQFKKVCFI